MNCRECHDWLQRNLDDRRLSDSPDVADHLRDCAMCRRQVAAARALLDGLIPKRAASPFLTASIAAAVQADRAARRRRSTYRWRVTAALAASLLLLVGIGLLGPSRREIAPPIAFAPPPKQPAVQSTQSANDAQKAVASLTRSVTETTRSRINVFLPDKPALDVAMPGLPELDNQIDPAAQSLKLAGLSVAHTLDPVADTAMQAFGFFAREMHALDLSKN